MNQDNNFNQNDFNSQGNNGISNNQPLNNQNINTTYTQQTQMNSTNMYQQPVQPQDTFNNQAINTQPNYQQPIDNKSPKKSKLGLIIGIVAIVVIIIGLLLIFLKPKDNENDIKEPNNNQVEEDNRDTSVAADFTYEHSSFWIDEEEQDIFTFIGNDRVKFYSVSNYGRYNTGTTSSSNSYNEDRGIAVMVDDKYIVVVSNQDYRGTYWTTQGSDTSAKYECLKDLGSNIYCLSSGKYQMMKEIDGKQVYFYTNLTKVANDITDANQRLEKIYEILTTASNTIVKYDESSFAIDKVVQDEFDRFNLKVNSYENITYYCSDLNSNYNAQIQIDNYIFKVIFKEITAGQQFNYKTSDYKVGNNSIGYYSSGSHTNLTIQNLDSNNIYQNDYLIVNAVSVPTNENKTILEYAPELLNKVFD